MPPFARFATASPGRLYRRPLAWRAVLLTCALHAVALSAAASDGAPDPCASAGTQAALGECSYDGFLKASAAMSAQLRLVEASLRPGQRTTWRRVQKAWLTYRTQACHFESSQLADGSARAMVQWRCAARMTRERSTELARLANCREGDLACPARNRSGKAQ